jgi:hypothetical protein
MIRALLATLFLTFAVSSTITAAAAAGNTDTAKLKERLTHSRAVDSLIWSLPLMSYKAMRDGYKMDGGVGFNEVGYNSQIQNWKLQITTPNNTTPYVLFFWDTKDGPVVIEIPPSGDGVSLFGPLMDSWQRPLEDVGAKGKDEGRGGKYLVMPPNYRGPLPMNGYYPLRQKTYQGYSLLRPIIANASKENLAKAVALVKKIKIYPLAKADASPPTKHIDVFGKNINALPAYDGSYFKDLHEIVQEEFVETKDIAMMGILNAIGIRKGMPFNPDAKRKALFDRAGKDALQYLIELYHNKMLSPYYAGRQWTPITPPGIRETEYTWVFPTHVALEERGTYFQAIFSSLKTLGAATFYMITSKDGDGKWLEGGNSYKLTVPANVPVEQFWSAIVYDLQTAAFAIGVEREGIASSTFGLKSNADGSVDLYFGPKAPAGKKSNWVPTIKGRKFFLAFRFYGPKAAMFDKSWQINDVKKQK